MATVKKQNMDARILDVLENDLEKGAAIADIIEALDRKSIWPGSFLSKATFGFKRMYVRGLLKRLRDDNGLPLFPSVQKRLPGGECVRVYKSRKKFSISDYKSLWADYQRSGRFSFEMAGLLKEECEEKHGPQKWLYSRMDDLSD